MAVNKSNEKKLASLKKQESKISNNPKALNRLKGKIAGVHTKSKK